MKYVGRAIFPVSSEKKVGLFPEATASASLEKSLSVQGLSTKGELLRAKSVKTNRRESCYLLRKEKKKKKLNYLKQNDCFRIKKLLDNV
jgi:hypothetical protein